MNGWKKRKAVCFLACATALVATGCRKDDPSAFLNDVIVRENYESVYAAIGARVTIDQVSEKEYGRPYATVDGKEYELGMDFLSMAMVYNAKPAGAFKTARSAYEEWWRLYMRRWNYLVPEVPLYSNQYYDVYNAKIDKLQTNPYWDVSDAIVSSRVIKGENAVVLGSSTELTGAFRDAAFGKSSAGAADLDIQSLTSGYSTVVTDMGGSLVWAGDETVRFHSEEKDDDGTKVFTVQIADDLTFSDGSAITAVNYLAPLLAGSSKVFKTAGGSDAAGLAFVGYEEFNAYDGTGEPTPFSGVSLLDEHTFQVRVRPEYADYYYALKYGVFTPAPLALYLGKYTIKDDGGGAYIEKGFYARAEKNGVQTYAMADTLASNLSETSARAFPYSGPYYVDKYDKSSKTATLKRNPFYKGDIRGKAQIETVSFVKIVSETQLDQLKKGRVDVLAGVTGGEETKAALSIVDGVKFKETHYDRAGYGKLAFRCDFGPTQFAEVRRAIMHTIDRNEFAQTFTGGYGSVVDAPYYAGSDTYLAVKDRLGLNRYGYSIEKAKRYLRDGGWVYNADGSAYDEKKAACAIKS
ncbi:MAG: hypothetical protein IJ317_02275 [Clostridia bacterium]|nr:hypothetical protein [Clostridia bacterium]